MNTIQAQFTPLPGKSKVLIPDRLPLPGVIIFVHGVNSDGEWYEAAEAGLCEGLNKRLARQSEQMDFFGLSGGQLVKATYTKELTSDGFIQPTRNDKTFIAQAVEHYSNVIRFRWGFKASLEELKEFGPNVWLNEQNYWGGGPFANGCSSIADLWSEGLNDRLFLWITAQHLNPVPGRDAYQCPPRPYYVHAALRLARLIESIRTKQPDCPITVVCHSQGNMVGIGAAFLADKIGVQADNYILNNPPLSLVPDDLSFTESWTQRGSHDPMGASGRQNDEARRTTLANFFQMIRERADKEQAPQAVDGRMANTREHGCSKGYSAQADREAHGLNGHTYGRVTLYCNPHDQVISALTVQGIGWRGMSQEEISKTKGQGVFTQRVFAQGYQVGQAPGQCYDYWNNRWNKDLGAGKDGFWHPPSPTARFSFRQGVESNTTVFGKVMTWLSSPFLLLVNLANKSVSAEPPSAKQGGWKIPIDAPQLPEPFLPKASRYGAQSDKFDEGYDPSGNARNANKAPADKNAADPYDSHHDMAAKDGSTDAPMGDEDSEAQLRYEDRARLRMKARRADKADPKTGQVTGEDEPDQATPEYQTWRTGQIADFLSEGVNQNATDHSTIVTNAMHAAKAMAYDVAIGVCKLTCDDMQDLRVEADWRYAVHVDKKHPRYYLREYFVDGTMNGAPLQEWVKQGEAAMPDKIKNERVWKAPEPNVGPLSHIATYTPRKGDH